jgi:2-hydroxy-6-oxonona-2,4-dienedioate hydrolase
MRANKWIGIASAVGTAAAAGSAYVRYRHDLKDRNRALKSAHRQVETGLGAIEYAREGTGPAALVIHGAGGGFDQGLYLGRKMLGAGFDLIAPSRFGYLGTPSPADVSSAAQADAHATLLDRLEIDNAIVLGVSAGAPSAIEFAVRYPKRVRALILVVPRAYDPDNQVGVDTAALSNKAVIGMFERSADFSYWLSTRVARQPLVRFFGVDPQLEAKAPEDERKTITTLIHDMLPLSARVEGLRNDTATPVTQSRLEAVTAPTLVISAEDDLYHTLPGARYTAAHICGADLRVFETGGHLLVSRGVETRSAIADFLMEKLGLAVGAPALAADSAPQPQAASA